MWPSGYCEQGNYCVQRYECIYQTKKTVYSIWLKEIKKFKNNISILFVEYHDNTLSSKNSKEVWIYKSGKLASVANGRAWDMFKFLRWQQCYKTLVYNYENIVEVIIMQLYCSYGWVCLTLKNKKNWNYAWPALIAYSKISLQVTTFLYVK